jgi:hypothetical protein
LDLRKKKQSRKQSTLEEGKKMKVIEKREWLLEIDCVGCTSTLEIEFSDIFEARFDHSPTDSTTEPIFCWACCVCGTRNEIASEKFPMFREVWTEKEWLAAKEATSPAPFSITGTEGLRE